MHHAVSSQNLNMHSMTELYNVNKSKSDEDENIRKRSHLLDEFYQTEIDFSKSLQNVVKAFTFVKNSEVS